MMNDADREVIIEKMAHRASILMELRHDASAWMAEAMEGDKESKEIVDRYYRMAAKLKIEFDALRDELYSDMYD